MERDRPTSRSNEGPLIRTPGFYGPPQTPNTMYATVELLFELDTKIRANNARKAAVRNVMEQFTSPHPTRNSPRQVARSIPTRVAIPSVTPAQSSHVPGGLAPMYLSVLPPVSQHCGPLQSAERTRRTQAGLCMYCCQSGHFTFECSLSRRNGPARAPVMHGVPSIMDLIDLKVVPVGNA